MVHRNDSLRAACTDFERDLVLYYFDDCAGTERSRIEAHLEGCTPCRRFLEDVQKLLPLTVKPDDPPQAFWESYSRELRGKLAAVEPKRPWWKVVLSFFRPWPVPAVATALILVVALALTLAKHPWQQTKNLSTGNQAFLEILPMAENLEFFKNMELLDAMDLIEAVPSPENGTA
jgi:predicted anti-sigma-YlaC factor YlaD